MEAIINSTGMRSELTILDNNDRKHSITVDDEGTVYDHEVTAYPSDPADRTPAENEHVNQARRYARYTLMSEENELLAMPLAENPELLFTGYQLMENLKQERFDELFRDIALQLASHENDEITPLVTLPRNVSEEDFVFYRTDLYMGVSDDFSMDDYNEYIASLDLDTIQGSMNALMSGNQLAAGIDYIRNIGKAAAVKGSGPLNLISFNARSNIRPVVVKPDGRVVEPPAGSPIDEPPSGRLELPPIEPGTREEFQAYLAYHLLCRARDSYLGMGVEPKREVFKVQGHGMHEYTQRYRALEMYDDYHDPDADISSWNPRETTQE